jgi:hypothetical protein
MLPMGNPTIFPSPVGGWIASRFALHLLAQMFVPEIFARSKVKRCGYTKQAKLLNEAAQTSGASSLHNETLCKISWDSTGLLLLTFSYIIRSLDYGNAHIGRK